MVLSITTMGRWGDGESTYGGQRVCEPRQVAPVLGKHPPVSSSGPMCVHLTTWCPLASGTCAGIWEQRLRMCLCHGPWHVFLPKDIPWAATGPRNIQGADLSLTPHCEAQLPRTSCGFLTEKSTFDFIITGIRGSSLRWHYCSQTSLKRVT